MSRNLKKSKTEKLWQALDKRDPQSSFLLSSHRGASIGLVARTESQKARVFDIPKTRCYRVGRQRYRHIDATLVDKSRFERGLSRGFYRVSRSKLLEKGE